MVINSKKTKEMILDTADKSSPPLLTISNNPVQRVTCFKLLGINRCFFVFVLFVIRNLNLYLSSGQL